MVGSFSFDSSRFNELNGALGAQLLSFLPSAAAARGLQTAALASAAAQRSKRNKSVDFSNTETQARIAEQRAKNFNRLSAKLDRTVSTVTKAREKLLELKEFLSDMRKQIVLAQSGTIDDTQRRVHADTFDQLLGQLNLKVRSAGGTGGNIIGSSIRDIFTPDTLTYKTRPDSPVDQTISGVYSGSDYVITDGSGDTYYPSLFGAILQIFPTVDGDDGELVSESDTVVFDPDTGALSITHDGEGTPFLSGTLERKGLGVVHSFLYGNFTDSALLDDALADVDAASSKLRFNIAVIESQLTKATAHRDFNEQLVEEHRELAQKVQQEKTLAETTLALDAQRSQLLFANAFQSTASFDGRGSLLSLGVASLFDFSA